MARQGTEAISMYNNTAEKRRAFQVVKAHYGEGYSNSEILADLVRKKADDIENGDTRRSQIKELRGDILALTSIVNQLVNRVETIERILDLLRRDNAPNTDHA